MRVPVSWLREYIELDQPVTQLAHLLTIAGLEVTAIEDTGSGWDRVFVGMVERIERVPEADRLVLATVNYGTDSLTVVTGAPNIAEGQKVALALEGAVLVDAYADTPRKRKLKATKIKGIRSEGMVCSERELGLSSEHEGILVLDGDATVGEPLATALGDHILTFDLPNNLAYANSVVGLAREIAHYWHCSNGAVATSARCAGRRDHCDRRRQASGSSISAAATGQPRHSAIVPLYPAAPTGQRRASDQ